VENCGAGPRPSLVECADKTSLTTPLPPSGGGGYGNMKSCEFFQKKEESKDTRKKYRKGFITCETVENNGEMCA
jgi:hypothetical protein